MCVHFVTSLCLCFYIGCWFGSVILSQAGLVVLETHCLQLLFLSTMCSRERLSLTRVQVERQIMQSPEESEEVLMVHSLLLSCRPTGPPSSLHQPLQYAGDIHSFFGDCPTAFFLTESGTLFMMNLLESFVRGDYCMMFFKI